MVYCMYSVKWHMDMERIWGRVWGIGWGNAWENCMLYVDGHCCAHCSVCVCPGLAEEIPSSAERLDADQTQSLLTRPVPGGNTKHQISPPLSSLRKRPRRRTAPDKRILYPPRRIECGDWLIGTGTLLVELVELVPLKSLLVVPVTRPERPYLR